MLDAIGALPWWQHLPTEERYIAFAKRYAAAWPAPWADKSYCALDARGASNLDELRNIIAPHIIRRTKRQIFPNYSDPEVRLITFDRAPDKRESAFTPEMLRQYDNPILSLPGLAEVLKESAMRKLPDCVEFLEDRLQEEEKIVVFAWNKDVIAMLQSSLTIYPSVTVTGESTDAQRQYARTAFQTDPRIRLFFGNILSAGEALDLSAANTSVFVQTTWVPKDFLQAVQRTESMAKIGNPSTAYVLTLERSIDHYQINTMFKKLNVIDQVLPLYH